MKVSKRVVVLTSLLVLCVLIHIFSQYTDLVESLYSTGFYKSYSAVLRTITGKLPFSIGDIFYGVFFAWLIWKIVYRLRRFRWKSGAIRKYPMVNFFYKSLVMVSCLYIFFNISWGINYNREGISSQLELKIDKYSVDELQELNCLLAEKVVTSKQILENKQQPYPQSRQLFEGVTEAYNIAGKKYPFIVYRPPAMKPSLWDWAGNYMGFTGYYNPFTGEAQISTSVPKFLQPFIACHEAAHQAGYAKEQEANFVGYLAGSMSKDTLFQYSIYLDLFIYANRNLYKTDSATAKLYVKDLGPLVLKDLQEWREFNRRHKSFFEPAFRLLYGLFLKGNQQPQGLLSYDEVTGFMIAYYKKFGRI